MLCVCRVLLAVIGISYLVCVLFISGVQKEDLEVSLLKKLQHYNIDFDKNNKQLRAECLNHSSVDPEDAGIVQNTTEKSDITTTRTTIAPLNGVALDTTELNSVLKFLKHKKKCRNPNTTLTSKTYENSDEEKRLENLEKNNRVYEKLTNENHDNQPSNQEQDYVTIHNKKEISTEDMTKYLSSGILSANNTGNKNFTKIEDKITNGFINKDVDISEFNTIAKIEKMLAEYLSKKKFVSTTMHTYISITPTTTSAKEIPNSTTEVPQINNVHEIEQKLVSGIDAINKLNENIAILQKNINGVKVLQSNISAPWKESETKIENTTGKLIKKSGVLETNITNILTNVSDNRHKVNTETTQYAPMLSNTNSNIKYSPVTFTTKVNNTLDIFGSSDVKESYIESHLMDSQMPLREEDIPIPHNTKKLDTFELWNKYYSQNIPEYLHSSINRQLNMDIAQQGLKEITNYSYKKKRIAHNPNAIKIQKNYQNHITMPYVTDPHYFEDLTNSGFNYRQPENLIQPVQIDGLRNLNNGYLIDKDIYSFNSDNIIPEKIKLPAHLDYTHFFENVPNQFPLSQKRVEQTTHSAYNILEEPKSNVDIQNALEVLKNDKHPHSLQTQSINIVQNAKLENENQKEHPQKSNDNFFNNYLILNKSSETQNNQNSLSFDTIIKIAESVKAIVLKDLKIGTVSSTKTATSTTTTLPLTTTSMPLTIETKQTTIVTSIPTTGTIVSNTTSTPVSPKEQSTLPQSHYATNSNDPDNKMQTDDSKVKVASQALEKFIQILQEIKSLQRPTVKYSKKKQSTKPMTKQISKVPVPLPNLNPFGMRVPPLPVVLHNYINPTISGPPFPPNFIKVDDKSSMSRVPTPINFVPHPFPDAVLIQSNLHEIQPLGVPVAKPEAINMNIVVTTEYPWDRKEKNQWNYMYKHSRSPDKQKDIENIKNTFDVYSNDKIVCNVPVSLNDNNKSSDAIDRNGATLQGSQQNISSHTHFNEYVSKIAKLNQNTINYFSDAIENPNINKENPCLNEKTVSGSNPSNSNLNEGNFLPNHNLSAVSDIPTGKVNVILMKDINDYFKPHQTEQITNLILKNGNNEASYLRPTLDNRNQETRSGSEKSENSNAKATFSKLEKYFDSPGSIESLGKKEYIRPTFKTPKFISYFSSSETTSPNDEVSNRDQRPRQFRPYHGIKSIKRGEGSMKQRTDKIDLIKELFERYNKHKGKEQSDDDRLKYKSLVDHNTKVQKPHDGSDRYGSKVRGFHKKLEGSNSWPASLTDCGTDENCKSSAKILSRDQIPMTSKKVSKYDDTRFKKFLKTQQKVNRMLEIILATKAAQMDSTETKASYI